MAKQGKRKFRKGITLIELIVSMVAMVMIAIALVGLFAAGVQTYRRSQDLSMAYADAANAQVGLELQLRNAKILADDNQGGKATRSLYISDKRLMVNYPDNTSKQLSQNINEITLTVAKTADGKSALLTYSIQADNSTKLLSGSFIVNNLDATDATMLDSNLLSTPTILPKGILYFS